MGGAIAVLLCLYLVFGTEWASPPETGPEAGNNTSNSPNVENGDTAGELVRYDILTSFDRWNPETKQVAINAKFGTGQYAFNTAKLPEDYRLEFEFERKPGAGTSEFDMMVGDRYLRLFVNNNAHNPNARVRTGIAKLDGIYWDNRIGKPGQSDIVEGRLLNDGQVDRVVFDVDTDAERNHADVTMSVNGEKKWHWSGAIDRIPKSHLKNPFDVVVGQWNGGCIIKGAYLFKMEHATRTEPK